MKRITLVTTIGAWIAVAVASVAQADEPPRNAFNGNVTLASDYIFRSQTQTNHKPALQGTLEYAHASGLYVGGFISNVSWVKDAAVDGMRVRNNLETDLWLGYRNTFGEDFSYDAGLNYYYYPGSYPGGGYVKPHTLEAYAQLGWKGLTLRYWYGLSDWFGFAHSVGSQYLDLSYNQELAPSWTLGLHLGRQHVAHADDALSFTDWRVGLTKAFDSGLLLNAAWTQGNARRSFYSNPDGHYITRGTLTVSVTKPFSF
jgi:uncharacterized protein (TIGR02001 family)